MTSRLEDVLLSLDAAAVAVSGGVDSLTLATLAHRLLGARRVTMMHAVSPAVPGEATERKPPCPPLDFRYSRHAVMSQAASSSSDSRGEMLAWRALRVRWGHRIP